MTPRRPAVITHPTPVAAQPQQQALLIFQPQQSAPQPSAQIVFSKGDAQKTLDALKAGLQARSEKRAAFFAALSKTENAFGEHPAEESIRQVLAQKIVAEKKKTQ